MNKTPPWHRVSAQARDGSNQGLDHNSGNNDSYEFPAALPDVRLFDHSTGLSTKVFLQPDKVVLRWRTPLLSRLDAKGCRLSVAFS